MTGSATARPDDASGRWRRLPDPIRREDTVVGQESGSAPDPDVGRNPDREFMLRHAG
ncbi:MAG: hypothetical protein WB441_10485 [Nocardioidaceae bacterium]